MDVANIADFRLRDVRNLLGVETELGTFSKSGHVGGDIDFLRDFIRPGK